MDNSKCFLKASVSAEDNECEEPMKNAVFYIHGKGGSGAECEHYRPLFPGCEVFGLDYQTFTPWETGAEIRAAVEKLKTGHENIILICTTPIATHEKNTKRSVASTVMRIRFLLFSSVTKASASGSSFFLYRLSLCTAFVQKW